MSTALMTDGCQNMLNREQFEERAAWLEFCDGMTRFQAETEAARRQGMTRWQALEEIKNADSKRNSARPQDQRQADARNDANHMPGMQRQQAEQNRSVSERVVSAGWGCLALLALWMEGGAVL